MGLELKPIWFQGFCSQVMCPCFIQYLWLPFSLSSPHCGILCLNKKLDSRDLQTISIKSKRVFVTLWAIQYLSQSITHASIRWKRTQTMGKWMGMAMFQENCIDKSRWLNLARELPLWSSGPAPEKRDLGQRLVGQRYALVSFHYSNEILEQAHL